MGFIVSLLDQWTANRRLLHACSLFSADRGDPVEMARRALEDGADPNRETFHRRWRKPTGRRNGEPVYGDEVYRNHWRTPLSCAVEKGSAVLVDMLLSSGADPWAPGNGATTGARPSAMNKILLLSSGDVGMVAVLEKHFDHVLERCPLLLQVDLLKDLDRFLPSSAISPDARKLLEKLQRETEARTLQQQTIPCPPKAPRPRL